MDREKKDFGAWWVWVLFLIVLSSGALGITRMLGLWGGTVAERVIFENSFQYSEARKAETGMYSAQAAEIRAMLNDPTLDASTRAQLEGQLAAIRIQSNVSGTR